MKVTVLEPVEPLTPQEVSRITEVPVPWLSKMMERGKIAHVKTSWLRLIQSSDLDKIRSLYASYLNRRKRR